jgi:protein-S-isoprenylcysteine O-methyltransferase Ste14
MIKMKLKFYINLNKGLTAFVMLSLIAAYGQWENPTAWVYLALHGTYGILWVIKSFIFPDSAWERKTSTWFGIISWFALVLYWIPGWLLVSRDIHAPAWYLGLCISMYILGIFFHFTSDMQKHVMLEFHPKELISDRMMALSRNINYFGEFLVYLSFALLPMTWIALIPLTLFIFFYWSNMMKRKERSLAQKTGYQDYIKRTKRFIPFLF